MKAVNVMLILIGVAVFSFGALMTLGGFIQMNDPEKSIEVPSHVAFMLILGLGPMVAGAFLVLTSRKRMVRDSSEAMERRLLQLARRQGGKLTVALATMELNMPSQEVKALLDTCHSNGLANIHANDRGEVEYLFFDEGRSSLAP